MVFLLIYLLGVILSIWSIIDVFNTHTLKTSTKVFMSFCLVVLSWLAIFLYTYVFKPLHAKRIAGKL